MTDGSSIAESHPPPSAVLSQDDNADSSTPGASVITDLSSFNPYTHPAYSTMTDSLARTPFLITLGLRPQPKANPKSKPTFRSLSRCSSFFSSIFKRQSKVIPGDEQSITTVEQRSLTDQQSEILTTGVYLNPQLPEDTILHSRIERLATSIVDEFRRDLSNFGRTNEDLLKQAQKVAQSVLDRDKWSPVTTVNQSALLRDLTNSSGIIISTLKAAHGNPVKSTMGSSVNSEANGDPVQRTMGSFIYSGADGTKHDYVTKLLMRSNGGPPELEDPEQQIWPLDSDSTSNFSPRTWRALTYLGSNFSKEKPKPASELPSSSVPASEPPTVQKRGVKWPGKVGAESQDSPQSHHTGRSILSEVHGSASAISKSFETVPSRLTNSETGMRPKRATTQGAFEKLLQGFQI